ncbi:MAG: argininosuccinate lyase [Candidatus Omnitrophota bacterium]
MGKLWGGRFSEEKMNPMVMDFTSSLDVDKELVKYDCLSSKIHVEMLAECGFISSEEAKELTEVIDELLEKTDVASLYSEKHEDIHSLVQEYVEKRVPIAGKKLHTGRSRNEQVVNDVRLYCVDNIKSVKMLIAGLQKSLTELAEKTFGIIVPGYTHINRAQPILFSHLLMAYVEMLERDWERLEDASKRLNVSVMGSGALAGSALKLDRKFVAKKFGFKKVSENSIDAVSDRDFIAEFVSGLCFAAVHLSRMSEDFILYSTAEFGFLKIGAEYCTGSSLMPQKKNPDVLELIRGKSAYVISALNTLFILLKGLPHSYNRDLQEDKKPLFESVKIVASALQIMADLVSTIILKKEAALEMLDDEFIYATDLAEYLVRKGVAFKDAHQVVGKIVKHCDEHNLNISDLTLSELKEFSDILDTQIYGLLNAETSVKNKQTVGSTNPGLVRKEIERWKKKLK